MLPLGRMLAAAAAAGSVIGLAVGFAISKINSDFFTSRQFVGWMTDEYTRTDAITWAVAGIIVTVALTYILRKISN